MSTPLLDRHHMGWMLMIAAVVRWDEGGVEIFFLLLSVYFGPAV